VLITNAFLNRMVTINFQKSIKNEVVDAHYLISDVPLENSIPSVSVVKGVYFVKFIWTSFRQNNATECNFVTNFRSSDCVIYK
jgi:hypothetical protein